MKFKFIAYFAILTSLVFSGCDSKDDTKRETVEKKEEIKTQEVKVTNEFKLTSTDGKIFNIVVTDEGMSFKELQGKAVLLNFWATWCAPCKAEIPHLVNLKNKYNENFEIIAVLLEENMNKEILETFISTYNINYPITIGESNFTISNAIGGIKSIPTMFLFDKEGKLVQKFIGIVPEEMLESDIKKGLGI